MSIEANLRNVWKAAKSGKDGQIVSGVASGEEGVIRYLSFISSTGARQQHADQPARAANQSAQFLQSNPPSAVNLTIAKHLLVLKGYRQRSVLSVIRSSKLAVLSRDETELRLCALS